MGNRTITYQSILDRYQQLAGIETMTTAQKAAANQFINRNIKAGWEFFEWPWSLRTEERTPDSNNLIEYEQAGETVIADVITCYRYDPYGTQGVVELAYQLNSGGIQFFEGNTYDPTYVYFREGPPIYTGADYAAMTSYVIGDKAFYPTTGDYYLCIANTTGNVPSNTTYWLRLTIPYDLMEYVVAASCGDLLLANGQNDRGFQLRNEAQNILLNEVEKYERQQSYQPLRRTFFTHGTEQLRNT
jgi:hypothetical protein